MESLVETTGSAANLEMQLDKVFFREPDSEDEQVEKSGRVVRGSAF